MRCQLLQLVQQALVDVVEVQLHVDVQRLLCLFGHDVSGDVLLEPTSEFGDILLLHSEAHGVGMSTEVLQQVAARLDGLVDVEACH